MDGSVASGMDVEVVRAQNIKYGKEENPHPSVTVDKLCRISERPVSNAKRLPSSGIHKIGVHSPGCVHGQDSLEARGGGWQMEGVWRGRCSSSDEGADRGQGLFRGRSEAVEFAMQRRMRAMKAHEGGS